jgi:hypothetical protein
MPDIILASRPSSDCGVVPRGSCPGNLPRGDRMLQIGDAQVLAAKQQGQPL